MQELLRNMDFTKFKPLEKKLLDRVDKMLAEDVPKLMSMIPQEEHAYLQLQTQSANGGISPSNTVFNDQLSTPFELGGVEGINAGLGESDWIVTRSRHEYDQVFTQLLPQNGKISGAAAKQEMVKSKLVSFSIQKIFILLILLSIAE
jgi:hypothetical protein